MGVIVRLPLMIRMIVIMQQARFMLMITRFRVVVMDKVVLVFMLMFMQMAVDLFAMAVLMFM